MCQFHRWLSGVALDIPPWILVLMTYEKRAFLWYPVPADSQFSRSTVKSIIVGLTVLFAIRNSEVVAYQLTHAASYHNITTSQDLDSVSCLLKNTGTSVFLELLTPWLNLLLRVLSPFVCLSTYNALIVRKLYRESYCANMLMTKVGIAAPVWLHRGLTEADRTMRRTVVLTVFMLVCGLPYSLYFIVRPLNTTPEGSAGYQTGWRLSSSLLCYVNYGWLYALFAVEDHRLLLCLRDTWRHPMIRKRGTNVASAPPRLLSPTDSLPALSLSCFATFFSGKHPDRARRSSIQESQETMTRTSKAAPRRDSRSTAPPVQGTAARTNSQKAATPVQQKAYTVVF